MLKELDLNYLPQGNMDTFWPNLLHDVDRVEKRYGYPRLTSVHRPLYDFAMAVRAEAVDKQLVFDREKLIESISKFYGLRGPVIPVSALGHAIVATTEFFTSTAEEIIIPEPAYPFQIFLNLVPNNQKHIRRINSDELRRIVSRQESTRHSAIIEPPRGGELFAHMSEDYHLLATPGKFNIVVYDLANIWWGNDIEIINEMNGNRLNYKSPPMSDRSVRLISTSKLLPKDIPTNFACVELSEALNSQWGEKYREFIRRMGFATPSDLDLYVMNKIFQSELLPLLLTDLRNLSHQNYRLISNSFAGFGKVILDGQYAWVQCDDFDLNDDYDLDGVGIIALHSSKYITLTKGKPNFIRVSLADNKERIEELITVLKRKRFNILQYKKWREEKNMNWVAIETPNGVVLVDDTGLYQGGST